MKTTFPLTNLVVVTLIGGVVTGGCTSSDNSVPPSRSEQPAPLVSPSAPLSTPLPDLSDADAFVSAQIRAQHASMLSVLEMAQNTPAARGEAYGNLGKLLMAAALLDAAEPYFLQAQTQLPTDTRWPYYLGHLYVTQGALEKSVAAFEEVLRLRPDDAVTMISLGDVYLLQGQPDAAEVLFTRQLTLQPNSIVANVGLGRAALAKTDYEGAVRHLEEGLRLSNQTAVGVHYPLALAYRGLGQQDKAEEHLQQRVDSRILPSDPLMEELGDLLESPGAYENRGNRALSDRQWDVAAAHFRKGLALEPSDPTMRHRLGTALFQSGDPSGAAAQWEQVVQTTPDFALAHYSLAVLLEGAGLRQEAIQHFETAVQHEPSYVEARLGLAALLRRSGRLEESLSQYEQVIERAIRGDPQFEEAPFGAAVTLVRLGRYTEARDRLVSGMAEYPGTPFFAHALARLLSGSPESSVRDGQEALSLLQKLPAELQRVDGGETLAMTLAELGQFTEATAIQRQALTMATQGQRSDLIPRMQEKLTRYESGRPWRSADPVEFDPFLERSAAGGR